MVILLPIKHYKQTTEYTCAPACLIMYCTYREKNDILTKGFEMSFAKILHTTPEHGTDFNKIVQHFERQSNYFFDYEYNGVVIQLYNNLNIGTSLIVLLHDDSDKHYVVVNGYNEEYIYFVDPYSDEIQSKLTIENFKSVWTGKYIG